MTDHAENIIEARNVSFSYGAEPVLSDITLAVHRGDYLGIVGPNGAGKTTLLKIMLGVLSPSSGSVRLFGTDIKTFRAWEKIGYVPQKALNFDAHFPSTAREVVLMGRYGRRGLWHRITTEDKKAADAAISQVGMERYRDRLIGDLSGGQQQRIFIARALAGEPEIMFLDEPTTGVDRAAQDEFYALLGVLNREKNITIVLISHDIERIAEEAMHIACVDRTLVCHTSPEEFLAQSKKIMTHNWRHAL